MQLDNDVGRLRLGRESLVVARLEVVSRLGQGGRHLVGLGFVVHEGVDVALVVRLGKGGQPGRTVYLTSLVCSLWLFLSGWVGTAS